MACPRFDWWEESQSWPQTGVDRFVSSPQRVDLGTIGGETHRHLWTSATAPWPGTRTSTCRAASPVGEHVAGEQHATVREEDRGLADGVRPMLDDLAHRARADRSDVVP